MIAESFAEEALSKFAGCDSDEVAAGSPATPSIWVLGIEHGTFNSRHEEASGVGPEDDSYSIEMQLRWPYNKKAFKLLASMHGYMVDRFLEFATTHQPFVKGRSGFFKGNLYPFACHDVSSWPERAVKATGTPDKNEYIRWCHEHRLPTIRNWIDEYQPRVIIGVGISCRSDFSKAVFGQEVELREKILDINGHQKRLFHFTQGWRKLVVIPHFSGAYGLNSNASLQEAGKFINEIMQQGQLN
ncbi:MAG: hypothetical protein HEQ17_14015 [Limnohabitans sp.]|jgi:hypothetical protein|uniref:hypothetical protein n=1 Tax=Limnohabitans sp. TaxID=1907725 RepID=UPI002601020B|nr:hypothetical protein [Limnohabitans sp.]MCO4089981.1 hypothetical protein [Limnohabitans sp.]